MISSVPDHTPPPSTPNASDGRSARGPVLPFAQVLEGCETNKTPGPTNVPRSGVKPAADGVGDEAKTGEKRPKQSKEKQLLTLLVVAGQAPDGLAAPMMSSPEPLAITTPSPISTLPETSNGCDVTSEQSLTDLPDFQSALPPGRSAGPPAAFSPGPGTADLGNARSDEPQTRASRSMRQDPTMNPDVVSPAVSVERPPAVEVGPPRSETPTPVIGALPPVGVAPAAMAPTAGSESAPPSPVISASVLTAHPVVQSNLVPKANGSANTPVPKQSAISKDQSDGKSISPREGPAQTAAGTPASAAHRSASDDPTSSRVRRSVPTGHGVRTATSNPDAPIAPGSVGSKPEDEATASGAPPDSPSVGTSAVAAKDASLIAPAVTAAAPQLTEADGTHSPTRDVAPQASPSTTADALPDVRDKHPTSAAWPGARLLGRMGQTEMHVGVRTPDFGTIEVHTTVNQNHVDAVIATAHPELRSAMQTELASLQHAMGRHQLQLDHLDVGSQHAGQSGGSSEHQGHPSPRPPQPLDRVGQSVHSPPEPAAWFVASSSGISVMA